MATDWAKDVRKYAANADDAVIAGVVRYCGIALRNKDSSLVSFSDPAELARVRNNFLKKKLGLKQSDDVLDAAIASVGERMKAARNKHRVTVYYLLAEAHDKLDLFVKAAKAPAATEKPAGKAKSSAKEASPEPVAAKPAAAKSAKPKSAKVAPKTAKAAAAEPAKTAPAKSKAAPKKQAPAKAAATQAPAAAPADDAAGAKPSGGGQPEALAADIAAPAPATANAAMPASPVTAEANSGLGWLWWLLAAALVAFAIWWI